MNHKNVLFAGWNTRMCYSYTTRFSVRYGYYYQGKCLISPHTGYSPVFLVSWVKSNGMPNYFSSFWNQRSDLIEPSVVHIVIFQSSKCWLVSIAELQACISCLEEATKRLKPLQKRKLLTHLFCENTFTANLCCLSENGAVSPNAKEMYDKFCIGLGKKKMDKK